MCEESFLQLITLMFWNKAYNQGATYCSHGHRHEARQFLQAALLRYALEQLSDTDVEFQILISLCICHQTECTCVFTRSF